MLSRLCHVLHRPLSTSTLEKDGARILRAVQKRVETRNQLLSKASRTMHPDPLTDPHIANRATRRRTRPPDQGARAAPRRLVVLAAHQTGT